MHLTDFNIRSFDSPGRSHAMSKHGMVASSHSLASNAGLMMLKEGGNALDAAIVMSLVLCMAEPHMTGIGGDCFALISRDGSTKNIRAINGSGYAGKKYETKTLKNIGLSNIEADTPHSVTIPGAVDAWFEMHKKFGKLDFEQLFITAENYARDGFPVHEIEAYHWKKNEDKLKKNKIAKNEFLINNKAPEFASKYRNIKLADTLSMIGKNGAKGFYEGDIAKDMVESLNHLGGTHTEEDFYNQHTIISDTLISNYKENLIHQCPPNGPGVIVHLMMKLLESFDWESIPFLSAQRFHIQAEVTKVCFELKETMLGDPNFISFNFEELMNEKSIEKLLNKISLEKVYHSSKSHVTSHPETVYLTVVDKDLNAVSFINSICHAFGSGICSEKSGVLFQNRGVNFRLEEGHPNCIESNKRPLHTIIPGLLTDKKNETIFSYGVMGGQYQPIGQAHVLQNIFEFGMNIQEAIDTQRAFALNGKLKIEKSFSKSLIKDLSDLGHDIQIVEDAIGGGQAIMIDRKKGVLIGGSDSRKDGLAIGY